MSVFTSFRASRAVMLTGTETVTVMVRRLRLAIVQNLCDLLNDAVGRDALSGRGASPNRHPGEVLVDLFAFLGELVGQPVANDPMFERFAGIWFDVVFLANAAIGVDLVGVLPRNGETGFLGGALPIVDRQGEFERLLGDQGLQIVSRLMGLFVCALAAQIIFTGVKNYLGL